MNTTDQTEIDDATATAMVVRDETAVSEALPPEQIKPPVTAAQAKVEAIADLTHAAYQKASELKLTLDESKALRTDFPDADFEPGAAGKENLIYIKHPALRNRLTDVLGMGQWAIIPRSRWKEDFQYTDRQGRTKQASRVYVEGMLVVRGCFVAESIGDMVYYPANESQNYGDAVDGAETNVLRRCCKKFGVGLQAWDKAWCEGWWARKRGARKNPTPAEPMINRNIMDDTQHYDEPIDRAPSKPLPNPKTVDEALTKQVEGMLVVVMSKPTAKGGTRWGLKVVHGPNEDTDSMWIGTFDKKLGENLEVLKGNRVIVNYRENGKYNDLVSIGPA